VKVFFSDAAKAEIAEIDAGISETNPARAERVLDALDRACDGLADMPNRFQLVPRFEHKGVRRRVVGDYLIFYRIDGGFVQILHVLHGATDYAVRLMQDQ